jgi:hypothetical protein
LHQPLAHPRDPRNPWAVYFLSQQCEQTGPAENNKRPGKEIANAAIQGAAGIDVKALGALATHSCGAAEFSIGDLRADVGGERGVGRELGGMVAAEFYDGGDPRQLGRAEVDP